jgi:hypothetical protein
MGTAFSLRPSGGKARKRHAMSASHALATIAIIWRGSREKWSVGGTPPSAADSIFLTRRSQLEVGAHVEFADLLE